MKDHCCRRSLQSLFQIWVSTLQRCIRFYFTYTVCSVLQDVDLSSSRSHTNPNVVVTFFCPAIRFWEPILAPIIFCLQVPVMAHSFHQHHQTWTDKSAILLMTMWTAQSVRTPLRLFQWLCFFPAGKAVGAWIRPLTSMLKKTVECTSIPTTIFTNRIHFVYHADPRHITKFHTNIYIHPKSF